MEKYKVSIVVPVYRVEKYLDRCIQSLLSQTLKEIEIILVDDASPDRCPTMCDEYASRHSNIRVIHKKNEGLGMARNSGMEVAQGEYICFVDSDDYVELDMLEKLYGECSTDRLDVIYSEFNVSDYPGYKVTLRPEHLYRGKQEIEELQLDMVGAEPEYRSSVKFEPSSCKGLYSMRLLYDNNVRFLSEREYISEDLLFNLDVLSCSERVKIVPWQFYHYCLNAASLTHTYRADRWEKNLFMLNTIGTYMVYFNRKNDLNLRLARTAMAYARMAINIEIARKGIKIASKIQAINDMISDSRFVCRIKDYPLTKLPLAWRIYAYCLKRKYPFLIYLMFKCKT